MILFKIICIGFISRETHAFLLNSRISARYNIITRNFFCEVIHNFVRRLSHSRKSLKLLPPDVRFYGQIAPNSISAGSPPQTPLGSLQLQRTPDLLAGACCSPLPKIPTPVLDLSGLEPRPFDPAVSVHFSFPACLLLHLLFTFIFQ